MNESLFRSERYFKVWQYSVSKNRLLLRSTRDNPPSTRIDIHFGAVGLTLLRPYYDGISIRRASNEERALIDETYSSADVAGDLFVIGEEPQSFVISGAPQWHEDEGGLNDPSWFGHMIGTK